jgi:hypothetical protein
LEGDVRRTWDIGHDWIDCPTPKIDAFQGIKNITKIKYKT